MLNSKNASVVSQDYQEAFDNYPYIENAATIKALLSDMLHPEESKRASAK